MAATPAPTPGRRAYSILRRVVIVLSFIPLIGVLFGPIAIIYSLLNWRNPDRKLALLGVTGIVAGTVFPYGTLIYFGFVQRDGIYDHLRTGLAQHELNQAVQLVERYKIEHGAYPDTLEQVQSTYPRHSFEWRELTDARDVAFDKEPGLFYYQKIDADHYYLRGVAPDGKPFSLGALVPQAHSIGPAPGLLTDPP
jgi:hypothetical protein